MVEHRATERHFHACPCVSRQQYACLLEKVSRHMERLHTASMAERDLNHRLTQEVVRFKTCIQHLNTYARLRLPSPSVSLHSCVSLSSPCERALAVFSPHTGSCRRSGLTTRWYPSRLSRRNRSWQKLWTRPPRTLSE